MAAFIDCKSIGLKSSQTKGINAALCGSREQELGDLKDRVYIEFASAEGSMKIERRRRSIFMIGSLISSFSNIGSN